MLPRPGIGPMLAAAVLLCGEVLAGCGRPAQNVLSARPSHLLDLTHTLSPRFPFIPVQNKTFPFRIAPIAELVADGVAANRWELTEHVGTHLDAPNHFAAGGAAVSDIPLEALWVPSAVLDLRARAEHDPDAELRVADVLAWERRFGRLPSDAGVFLLTGWGARAGDAQAFVNLDAAGAMHFPGFSLEVVEFLLRERTVSGLGTDTLSIDPGSDRAYLGHRAAASAGRWLAECVANLEHMPPAGATVFLAATKVEGATGAPARIVAYW